MLFQLRQGLVDYSHTEKISVLIEQEGLNTRPQTQDSCTQICQDKKKTKTLLLEMAKKIQQDPTHTKSRREFCKTGAIAMLKPVV